MATYKNFSEATRALKSNFNKARKKLPDVLANVGSNFFVDNFKRQGFLDESLNKWKPRKKVKNKRDGTRSILVKSGRLRRAVNNSLTSKTPDRIIWRVNLPYAEAMNDGVNKVECVKPHKRQASRTVTTKGSYSGLGSEKRKGKKIKMLGVRGNVKGFSRKMKIPARKFMGQSRILNRMFRKKIDATVMKALTNSGVR